MLKGLLSNLLPLLLDWLILRVVPLIKAYYDQKKKVRELDERQQERLNQAETIEGIRQEILSFRESNPGEPIPDELFQRLNDEARKFRSL